MEMDAPTSIKIGSATLVLSHSTIVDILYPLLSVKDILRVELVCRATRQAVKDWYPIGYNINNHLRHYFDDPVSFRHLQATTGTLISGSNVLQFFERTIYSDSDMDLYAPCRHALRVALWLEAHGYVFRPTPAQLQRMQRMPMGNISLQEIHGVCNATQISGTVAERYLQSVSSGSHPGRDPDANANASSLGLYGFGALETVLHFASKRNPSGEGAARRIDVIITSSTSSPLACILSFHSTIVMNFIAYDRACSLFPNATFIRNQCLTFGDTMTSTAIRDKIYPKYWKRGFKISALPLPLRPASPINAAKPDDFIDQETRIQFGDRFIGDKLMWSIPLEPPPFSDEDDRAKATLYSEALDICGFTLSTRLINPSQYAGFYQDLGQWPHKSDDQFPVIKFYLLCSVALENSYVLPHRYYPRTQKFLVSQQNLTYHFLALHEGMTLEGMGAEIQHWDEEMLRILRSELE